MTITPPSKRDMLRRVEVLRLFTEEAETPAFRPTPMLQEERDAMRAPRWWE